MSPIKCAGCGLTFPATRKDRPKQHRSGGTTCPGSAQLRRTHDQCNKAKEKPCNPWRFHNDPL